MPTLSELIPEQTDAFLDCATQAWHENEQTPASGALAANRLLELHRANYDLWHLEDDARDPNAPDSRIAECKRAIDRTNQRRNDLMEALDRLLLEHVMQHQHAPLHSETPGQMLDRASILSLKVHHTREEAERANASAEHRERNRQRLEVLLEQRSDLVDALRLLSTDVQAGIHRFRLYRQMKMYNDPELNPVLYRRGSALSNSS